MSTSDDGKAEDTPHRVVVRFKKRLDLPYSTIGTNAVPDLIAREWTLLRGEFPAIFLGPYFTSVGDDVLEKFDAAAIASQLHIELRTFFMITVPFQIDPKVIAARVREWDSVQVAYVECNASQRVKERNDDSLVSTQGYLCSAPEGIDAYWAWNHHTTGCGVGFVDLEQGWTLNHEDLVHANIQCISGVSKAWHGHGTAVLGIVVAEKNKIGGIGIAYDAQARVVSEWRTRRRFSTADAIIDAASKMRQGDVLLLETQVAFPSDKFTSYPIEIEDVSHGAGVVFAAIKSATNLGIVVIEPAGNGGPGNRVDLDTYQDPEPYRKIYPLLRGGTDFIDSDAVMVAGAIPKTRGRDSACPSNFGSRVDCFAWGENISTCGSGHHGTSITETTNNFCGTSGASAIIAGAAILVQAWAERMGRPRFMPRELRRILSDPSPRNTRSNNPGVDRIGVMPNLRNIIT